MKFPCFTLLVSLILLFALAGSTASFGQEEVTPVNRVQLKKWYEKRGLQPPADLMPYAQPVIVPNQILSPSNEPDVHVFTSSNPQTENSIAINQANPQQLMISTNGTTSSTGQTWFFSTNGGTSWFGSETSPNSVSNFGDPVALFNGAGTSAYWVTLRSPGGVGVIRTTNLGSTWGTMTNADPLSSSNDDKEHAMTDLSGVFPNNIYVAWTDFGVTQIGSRAVVTRSTDNGSTWSARTALSTGSDQGQGVNLATGPNGEVYCAMASYTGGSLPESGIRFAKSTDGGTTWTAAGVAFTISGIRTSSNGLAAFGGTRVNSFPSMGVDRSTGSRRGWIYITYADRNTGDADVYLRRSTDGGTTWSSAIRVNGETVGNGKQQWFPSVAVDPTNGDLSIGYYSMDSSGTNFLTNRYIAHSTDGGTTFDRFVVSDVRFTPSALGGGFAGGYMGDYYETAAYGGKAWGCWSDNRSGAFQAYVSRATYASSITVTAPNGGEAWAIGSSQAITWLSSGITGNVRVQLSRDGGSTFAETLFASTANDGTEPWTVTGPVNSTSRVRIVSVADSTKADTSNANFSIIPSLTVTVPNGGETWGVGTVQAIHWTSSGMSGTVNIELSRNGGGSYEMLFAGTANDGVEPWTVTSPSTSNALVRITSVSSPTVADVSNGPFTISASFTLLTKLFLHDAGGESDSLEYGTGAGATDGIDPAFGEVELPPAPPGGVFDVRWAITGTQGGKRDIRDTLGGTRVQIIYTGKLQPGAGGYPFVARWNRLQLPTGTFTLRDGSTGSFSVNMKQQDSLVIASSDVQVIQIVYDAGTTVTSNIQGGWNIVSLPVIVADRREISVFPTANSNAFAHTPLGYAGRDTLDYGEGYWLRFPSAQLVSVTGSSMATDTVNVTQGWNIIGSVSGSVPVANIIQIPGGIVISQYYGYTPAGYSASSSIDPMLGYWVRVTQNGRLVLSSPGAMSRRGPGVKATHEIHR